MKKIKQLYKIIGEELDRVRNGELKFENGELEEDYFACLVDLKYITNIILKDAEKEGEEDV